MNHAEGRIEELGACARLPNAKKYPLRYFIYEIEAAHAYDKTAQKYHSRFACLNFPGITGRAKLESVQL
jgi:hypothetical protein